MAGIDSFTKLILHMNSDFTDSSDNNHTPTVNGATIDTTNKKFGAGSGKFVRASSQYVTYPDHADFTLGSSNFVIDFWIRRSGTGTRQLLTGQIGSSGAISSASIYAEFQADNTFQITISDGTSNYLSTTTATFTTSTLTHFAGVRTGNTLRTFVDGVQDGSVDLTGVTVNDSSSLYAIGRAGEFVASTYDGNVDELRLSVGTDRGWSGGFTPPTEEYARLSFLFLNQRYNLDSYIIKESTLNQRYILDAPAGLFETTLNQRYALTAPAGIAESTLNQRYIQTGSPLLLPTNTPLTPITTTYTLTLTGPLIYDSALKMLLHMNEDFTDIIDTARISGVNGATIDRSTTIFAGPCGRFNAAQKQYVDFPDSPDWPAGTNSFTIEFRVKRNRLGVEEAIWGQVDPSLTITTSPGLASFNSSNQFHFHITSGSTKYIILSTTIFDSLTEINHIACVRDGNTLKLYVNGSVENTLDVTGIASNDSAYRFTVGRLGESDTEYFDGWIDEFAVWNTARSTFPSQEYGDPDPNVTEVIIPMASFRAEVKENKRSWLEAVIPNGKIYADAINARLGGEMYVTKYSTHTDGSVDSDEVARAVIEEISPVEGSFATTITMSGFKTTIYPTPKGIELIPANYNRMVTIDAGRQFTSGDAALTMINPGDQILLDSELFNASELTLAVNPRGTQIKIKERI